MMFNRAGLLAERADHHIRCRSYNRSHRGRHELIDAFHPSAAHAAVVQVVEQGIKALVTTEHEALGIRCSLKGPAELKGYVEVQGVLASARNLQEVHTLEPMGCGWLLGSLGRVLVGPHKNDSPEAFIQGDKSTLCLFSRSMSSSFLVIGQEFYLLSQQKHLLGAFFRALSYGFLPTKYFSRNLSLFSITEAFGSTCGSGGIGSR